MIIYLHGFRSSPQSNKAQRLNAHMAARGLGQLFWCEPLPVSPRAAIALAESAIAAARAPVTVVGSSLGGYYATHLAEKHKLRAVLINPAVVAHLSLAELVGPQTNLYTGETFDFRPEHIDELRAIEVPRLSRPEDVLLLVEEGDETLDYRQAVAKYAGCRQVVLPGGDHSFTRFADYMDTLLDFAGLTK
ncbi:MAG: esterase [Betaproteobacteria bacterium]|nr:esterase [Betaproteobacteria bacterium]